MHNALYVHGGIGGIAPPIFNVDTKTEVAKFTLCALSMGKEPLVTLIQRVRGHQNRSARCGVKKNLCLSRESNSEYLVIQPVA